MGARGRKTVFSVHAERKYEKGYLEGVNHQLVIVDLAGGEPVTVVPPLAAGLEPSQWARSWKP